MPARSPDTLCLALDTSLGACSAAVLRGAQVLAHRREVMSVGQAEALAPMVDEVMAEAGLSFANLTRLAVTTGPGTFTGQRIGLAFARGLGVALDIPCTGIGTLAALAADARTRHPQAPVFALSNARRGEVYAQAFDATGAALDAPALLSIAAAEERLAHLPAGTVLTGSGAGLLSPSGTHIIDPAENPDAVIIARLALAQPGDDAPPAPLYLRAPDAKLPGPLRPPPPQMRPRA
jgi:tRNA threonylcarbamoyladenosine biosynthesis protein TsaB